MDLEQFFSIGRAIVKLMEPLVEIVFHDIRTNKIIFIEGSLSGRKTGDPSLLESDIKQYKDTLVQDVYSKINFDGRLVKSISIPIKENNKIVALMCINCDLTVFEKLDTLTNIILKKPLSKRPSILFKNDWQERINEFIHTTINERETTLAALTNKEKKEIIKELYSREAFSEKNAAEYIAKIMNMSRATIFNYLRNWRKA